MLITKIDNVRDTLVHLKMSGWQRTKEWATPVNKKAENEW